LKLRVNESIKQSFLALHALISTFPLLLFLSFSVGVFAAATISAILFTLFWIGLALLVLLPTLFVTVSLGCFGWACAVTWVLVARYLFQRVLGDGESQSLVPVEKGNGERPWENANRKGVVERGEEVINGFEDVDCVGMMGGGMELGCG
jgi:hypothetical protein